MKLHAAEPWHVPSHSSDVAIVSRSITAKSSSTMAQRRNVTSMLYPQLKPEVSDGRAETWMTRGTDAEHLGAQAPPGTAQGRRREKRSVERTGVERATATG